jgi:heterotetrameric sarcosine oxidase gamma subunit
MSAVTSRTTWIDRGSANDLEFVTFAPSGHFELLPAAPGGAAHTESGDAVYAIAPRRWFAPRPGDALRATFEAAEAGGAGALVDVTGQWRCLDLEGASAGSILRNAIDIEAVLEGREIALVTLFDAPCRVARRPSGYRLWVRSSYAAHLMTLLERLGAVRAP